MANKMLIDASHPEETRVVVLRGSKVEEFDFESATRKQLRGNIYLAKVTRVEPSLQAAFVEYGGNRHGFLAFSEIHPDYYQIPTADRQALLEAEAQAAREEEDEDERRRNRRRRGAHKRSRPDERVSTAASEGERGSVADSEGDEPHGEATDHGEAIDHGNDDAFAAAETDAAGERAETGSEPTEAAAPGDVTALESLASDGEGPGEASASESREVGDSVQAEPDARGAEDESDAEARSVAGDENPDDRAEFFLY